MANKEHESVTSAKIARTGAIIVAIISFFGVVLAISSQTSKNPTNQTTEYFGRVIDINTLKPIPNAKIILDLEGVPPVVYTDSEGIYRFEVDIETKISGQIWVDAVNYQPYTRYISISPESTNLEDIRLAQSDAQTGIMPPTENTLSVATQVTNVSPTYNVLITATPADILLLSPTETVAQYYQYLNNGEYNKAWGMFSTPFKTHGTYSNIEEYKDWASNIIKVEVIKPLTILEESELNAVVEVSKVIQYTKTGTNTYGRLKIYLSRLKINSDWQIEAIGM